MKSHLSRWDPISADEIPSQQMKSHLRGSNPVSEDQIPSQKYEIPSQQIKSRLSRWNPIPADEIPSQQMKSRLWKSNPVSEDHIPSRKIKSHLRRWNPALANGISSKQMKSWRIKSRQSRWTLLQKINSNSDINDECLQWFGWWQMSALSRRSRASKPGFKSQLTSWHWMTWTLEMTEITWPMSNLAIRLAYKLP